MSEQKRVLRFGVSSALLGVALCGAPACSGGKETPKPEVESPSQAPAPEAAQPPAPPVEEAPDMSPDVAPAIDPVEVPPAAQEPINVNPGPYRPDEKP